MNKNEKPITWFQFNNIVPIITSTILIVISFFSLKTDVELVKQKVDIILAQQVEILSVYKNLSEKQNTLEIKLSKIETLQNLVK